MDFTEAYVHSNPDSILFSPSSTFFTCIAGSNPPSLLLRTSNKLNLVRSWQFGHQDIISSIQWSVDGQYLLVTSSSTSTIYVLYPSKKPVEGEDEDGQGWSAKLMAGAEGLSNATWLPFTGPPTVLQFALDDVRATATNLNDRSITILSKPKRSKIFPIPGRPSHFAMLERHSSKDHVGIYSHTSRGSSRATSSGENLELERSFPTLTNDSADLSWSPQGNFMAIWEKSLEYKLHIFTPLGHLRSTFMIDSNSNPSEPITISPHLKSNESSSESSKTTRRKNQKDEEELTVAGGGLGIRCVAWKPDGKLLAIGGYDDKVRLLENNEWTEVETFDLSKRTILPFTPSIDDLSFGELKAWSEPRNFLAETNARGIVTYNDATLPIAPAFMKATADASRPNPKMGVSQLAWNEDGTLLASRSDSMLTTVFIHAFAPSSTKPYLLAILTQTHPVQGFSWRPGRSSSRLAICCGTPAVYLWELFEGSSEDSIASEGGRHQQLAEAVSIPNDGFVANSLKWSPDGTKLILIGPDSFCCATESDS